MSANMLAGGVPQMVPGMSLGLAGLPSGRFWTPPGGSTTSNTRGSGSVYLTPIYVSKAVEISALIYEYTVAGSAGAVTRLNIFGIDSEFMPGKPFLPTDLIDDATVAAGVKTVPIAGNAVLIPGKYWMGAALQGAPTTPPTYRVSAGNDYGITGASASLMMLGSATGYQVTGITDAFPDMTGKVFNETGPCIKVGIKGA